MSSFRRQFGPRIDQEILGVPWAPAALTRADGYEEFAAEFAGASFVRGLYRFHDAQSGQAALGWIADAFPAFAQRATPFGFDWLGRQFALDAGRVVGGEPQVLMLEPGTGQALEIPASFVGFHDGELVDYADSALAENFFDNWAASNPGSLPLGRDKCVGYKVPLFLGGPDTMDNLELSDIEVYWSISGQLIRATENLPAGGPISGISNS